MKMVIDADELKDSINAALGYRDEILYDLLDHGMLGRVHEHSDTALYANFIPEEAFEEYDTGDVEKLGVDLELFQSFISAADGDIVLTKPDHRMKIQYGNKEYLMRLIDPSSVNGVPQINPDLDLPITLEGGYDWITDFSDEVYSVLNKKSEGGVFLSVQGGMAYLWAQGDVSEASRSFHLEDFEGVETDWDSATGVKDSTHEKLDYDPAEEEKINNIISTAFLRPIADIEGEARLEVGNYTPLKVVVETDAGVKHSWMIPPRIPSDGKRATVPDRIIKDRSL